MRSTSFVPALVLILCVAGTTCAQRTLDGAEALDILDKLASEAPGTWLPAGTIRATHEEYQASATTDSTEVDRAIAEEIEDYEAGVSTITRSSELQKQYLDAIPFNTRYALANEYTMRSDVTVKYDGTRFYWSIDVSSRRDSVTPDSTLTDNTMLDRFDTVRNSKRVFAWDGQEYTIQSISANHAIVDAARQLPRAVNGPLTAGVIPWGQGVLSSESLAKAEISAAEIVRDGAALIVMTIDLLNGVSIECALDLDKDYVPTSFTLTDLNDKITSQYCSDYRKVGSSWVPRTVLIEQHDPLTGRLLRSDKWDLTSVDAGVPAVDEFDVDYETDTVIEYHSPLATKASVYQYSNLADTDLLLADHLTYTASKGLSKQNCATAALEYTAGQLGKSLSDQALASLVADDGQTTMSDMMYCLQGLGLYCRAVRTDLASLQNLSNCQVILYIPGKAHFVVLDHLDDRSAWIVDLSASRFYYSQDKGFLPLDWSDGTALLVSSAPIAGSFDDLDSRTLTALSGGDGYTCTDLIQEEYFQRCVSDGYTCWGDLKWYYERWGCEAATSGSCSYQYLARYIKDGCVYDSIKDCTNEGDWQTAYMLACD